MIDKSAGKLQLMSCGAHKAAGKLQLMSCGAHGCSTTLTPIATFTHSELFRARPRGCYQPAIRASPAWISANVAKKSSGRPRALTSKSVQAQTNFPARVQMTRVSALFLSRSAISASEAFFVELLAAAFKFGPVSKNKPVGSFTSTPSPDVKTSKTTHPSAHVSDPRETSTLLTHGICQANNNSPKRSPRRTLRSRSPKLGRSVGWSIHLTPGDSDRGRPVGQLLCKAQIGPRCVKVINSNTHLA